MILNLVVKWKSRRYYRLKFCFSFVLTSCRNVRGFFYALYDNYHNIEQISLIHFHPVQPHHSWNSNFNIGRITLYELTRHSDHHYKSSKKYQVLDNHKECPTLPLGYPASILLSFVPPLWFWVMNPRVPNDMKIND